ncbi:hypothetical protein MS3_00008924 [Schistosoma haematobium]|uniref:Uncharacterized protein n=1 Tax=Schistosoma haematobium TaxID=6185 RepID=A0A922LDY9_SCHHA|nr:hypothetical protein MS3_00008924 [Schistosoma haematobium]KAH9580214.1 hypothetical protein MS3_00008924 [Schistosoma haematobium]
MCITSNNKDSHEFKVNGCKNKNSTVNVATESTTLATTETDLRTELKKTDPSTESHLNMTTDTTEGIDKGKSPKYVYIVVPLVISFLIVCIGCSIWLWFYRRNRVHP